MNKIHLQKGYCAVLDPDESAAEIAFPADGEKYLEKLRDITDLIPAADVNPFIVSIDFDVTQNMN